jgi:4-amino-4-deoxy-L-arabinose transferase-like glycosyltransferase
LRLHKQEVIVTSIIFLLLLGLRIPFLANPPFGEYDSWRQSDTEVIARNFIEHRFNIFFPQLNYSGAWPNYAQLELQVIPFLIALLYKCFGYHYALARIIPVLFFLGSAFFVYLIAKRCYTMRIAWLSLLLYGLLPINLLYSRAIMPESAALFFFTGAFYLFTEWIRVERVPLLLTASVLTSLAILEKIPTVFIGIPMIIMVWMKYKKTALFKWELYIFTIIALLPAWIYYLWLQRIAESTFVTGIAAKHILPHMLTSMFTENAVLFFWDNLPGSFTWYILLLGVVGFFITPWRNNLAIRCWALAMIVELITIVAVIQFDYYLIFLGPPLALLAAHGLDRLFSAFKAGKVIGCMLIVLFAVSAYQNIIVSIPAGDNLFLKQAEIVEKITNKEDLIVSGIDDPSLLNAAHRAGWRVSNAIPDNPIAELDYFVASGARYFVPLMGYIENDTNGLLKQYLEQNFIKIEIEKGYEIYKLSKK